MTEKKYLILIPFPLFYEHFRGGNFVGSSLWQLVRKGGGGRRGMAGESCSFEVVLGSKWRLWNGMRGASTECFLSLLFLLFRCTFRDHPSTFKVGLFLSLFFPFHPFPFYPLSLISDPIHIQSSLSYSTHSFPLLDPMAKEWIDGELNIKSRREREKGNEN